MSVGKVKLATDELQRAFAHGQRCKRRGDSYQSNPYRPCSDGDLWRAWNRGFCDRGSSKVTRMRRARVAAVVEKHGKDCWLCGKPIHDDLTMDHVLPRSKGGRATRDNLRPAHAECNVRRGNGPPPELLLTADMMLAQVGRNPKGENNEDCLSAKHEHAAAEGHAPVTV